jgi:hypothetical protein
MSTAVRRSLTYSHLLCYNIKVTDLYQTIEERESQMNGFAIAGLLLSLSGLIWTLAGNIPIGMMNVCIGMVFVTLSNTRKKK